MSIKTIHETTIKNDLALRIAQGDLPLPCYYLDQGGTFIDFPPALIPVWRDEICHVGFWHHWFCDHRSTLIVEVDPELGFEAQIKANSLSQLLIDFVFYKARLDGELTAPVEKFVLDLDLAEPEAIRKGLDLHFQDPENAEVLKGIPGDPPYYLDPNFKKDFMSVKEQNQGNIFDYCALEFKPAQIRQLDQVPPWMTDVDKQKLFDTYLSQGLLKEAWLTLHSRGWRILGIESALLALADKANHPDFSKFARAWVDLDHQSLEY